MAWLLFFDGDCAFCSRSVRTVCRLDRRGNIAFAPLQGELSQAMGFTHYAAGNGGTMVVLRESDGRVFTRSDGLIELATALGAGWRVFAVARIVPKCLRDRVYDWIARNRYRIMGKLETCSIPDPELQKRLRS